MSASYQTATSSAPMSLTLGEWSGRLSGQYRARFIGDTGRDFIDGNHPVHISQRARLGVRIAHRTGIGLFIQLQDVRIWGEELNTLNDFSADGFDVHQAYATLPLFGLGELRVGRQEINFENHRLIGNVGWLQRARSFDGLRLLLTVDGYLADLFVAKVREADQFSDGNVPDGRRLDVDLVGFRFEPPKMFGQKLAATYIFNGNYEARALRHTMGATLGGGGLGFRYNLEFFYQAGRQGGESVGAYLAAGKLSYTHAATGLAVGGFAELVSGDGTIGGSFDTLYATNHKFYGEMDFFLNIPANTRMLGLVDAGGRVSYQPFSIFKLIAVFHHFRSQTSSMGRNVFGNELDIKAVFSPWKYVQLRALYGLFLPDQLFDARGNKTEHFFYLTTDLKI